MSSSSSTHHTINAETCKYCYLDLDINEQRLKLGTAAAFVDATDSRYGFSSNDLRYLGGSELKRIPELISTDHEWSIKNTNCNGIQIRPPVHGNRIIIKLYWDIAPLACENFATLCANGGPSIVPTTKSSSSSSSSGKMKPAPIGDSGKPLTYRKCKIHRIIPNFILQGGDFVFGNGSGGESIYGSGNRKYFKDEKAGLQLKHNRCGLLSMGNSGKNSNTSQFFFTLSNNDDGILQKCDGKHVIFGQVQSGMNVLREAEQYGTKSGEPTVPIIITDCGIYQPTASSTITSGSGGGGGGSGYWYDQPDYESFTGISSTFIIRPRIILIVPTSNVGTKFASALNPYVSIEETIIFVATEGKAEEEEENSIETLSCKLVTLLTDYCIDLIIIAPACHAITKATETKLLEDDSSSLSSWRGNDDIISVSEIILQVKPIEALNKIHTQSWLSKRTNWQLDGNW